MSSAGSTSDGLSFEEAFRRLQDRVGLLTTGQLPLEVALSTFEEGLDLYRHCSRLLREAELRVSRAMDGVQA